MAISPNISPAEGLVICDESSSAWACTDGTAISTASKPECTLVKAPGPSVCSCQRLGLNTSVCMRVTWVSKCTCPWSCSGLAHCLTSAFMPGVATQCASLGGRLDATTRPASSRMRTVLALQRRTPCGLIARAFSNRASRTVKYCAPWSKSPNSVLFVDMRPPAPRLFSNTVTVCPACAKVRAQAMPAMPAPITAMWRDGAGGFEGADFFVMACFYVVKSGCHQCTLNVDGHDSSSRARWVLGLSSCLSHHCKALPSAVRQA